MQRFFFNLADGASSPDKEGVEFDDLASVREAAIKYLGQSLVDRPDEFWRSGGDWALTVTDPSGLTLFRLHVVATEAPSLQIATLPNPAT